MLRGYLFCTNEMQGTNMDIMWLSLYVIIWRLWRHIMTSNLIPAPEELNIYYSRSAVTYRYLNVAERADRDIYDDFKLKNLTKQHNFLYRQTDRYFIDRKKSYLS